MVVPRDPALVRRLHAVARQLRPEPEPAATSSRDPVDPAPLLSAEKSSSEALGP